MFRPEFLAEPLNAPMQVIRAVIDRELVRLSIQLKPAAGYSVRKTAHGASEIGMIGQVAIQSVESEHDVTQLSLPIRDVKFRDDRSEVGDLRHQAIPVRQGEKLNRTTVGQLAKKFTFDRCTHFYPSFLKTDSGANVRYRSSREYQQRQGGQYAALQAWEHSQAISSRGLARHSCHGTPS
jgi:hypothetical protein